MNHIKRIVFLSTFLALIGSILAISFAQGPPRRRHSVNQKQQLLLVPANRRPELQSRVEITREGRYRKIVVNGVPNHLVGAFPNSGNPHRISTTPATYRVVLQPQLTGAAPRPLRLGLNFGIAINGVLFDPGAAEYYLGNRRGAWQYEALSGAVSLGLDQNHAHVQPSGKYHYHGIPQGLLDSLEFDPELNLHSPLVGWAADGFPIYAISGFSNPNDPESPVARLRSSYRLKPGKRPGGVGNPGGRYDGTFVDDYQYVEGSGDLDPCNGRTCVTPDFPQGTYAYFLTEQWPVIPRYHRGTPDRSFASRRPAGRPSGAGGPRRPSGPRLPSGLPR